MSHPLGGRAKLKGPQIHKRILMKPQVATYFVQVKLPAAMQMTMRQQSNSPVMSTSPQAHPLAANSQNSDSTSRPVDKLPPFTEAELLSQAYATNYRGVMTATIPSNSTCMEAIQTILQCAGATDRPPWEFQLVQCFADFSPDHSRRRLTGDSTQVPIKTVMQFPFHLALVVSPFVILREKLQDEEEPRERAVIYDDYRRKFLVFMQGYQSLLLKLIDQSNFLRGREEEGRRGKKLEERQQFFELSRFRTLKEEKDERRHITNCEEVYERNLLSLMSQGIAEKLRLCDENSSPWLQEYSKMCTLLRVELHKDLTNRETLLAARDQFARLVVWGEMESELLYSRKQELYTISRLASNLDEGRTLGLLPEVVEARRRRNTLATTVDAAVPMIANKKAIVDDVYSSTRIREATQ